MAGPFFGGGTGQIAVGGSAFEESILESTSNVLSVSFDDSDSCYKARFAFKNNAASNNIYFCFNDDSHATGAAATGYYQTSGFSATTAYNNIQLSGNSSLLQSGTLAINDFASGSIDISRFYDGSNTRFSISFTSEISSGGQKNGHMTKVVAGDVPLTGFSLRSEKASGFAVGAYIKPI